MHVQMRANGEDRIRALFNASRSWLRRNRDASITYLVAHRVDLEIVWEIVLGEDGAQQWARREDGPSSGTIYYATYASWAEKHGEAAELGPVQRQVFILDQGFGVHTATMALLPPRLCEMSQNAVAAPTSRHRIHLVSVSITMGPSVQFPKRTEDVYRIEEESYGQVHEHALQLVDLTKWDQVAAQRMMDHGMSRGTIACIMTQEELVNLAAALNALNGTQAAIHVMEPGSDWSIVRRAIHEEGEQQQQQQQREKSTHVKLVRIHQEMSVVPPIHNLTGVMLAPASTDTVFDAFQDRVTRVRLQPDFRVLPLAQSLRSTDRSKKIPVLAWSQNSIEEVCVYRDAMCSPAFDANITYTIFGMVRMWPNRRLDSNPVRLPWDKASFSKMARRLEVWGLLEGARDLSGRVQIKSPLGASVAKFVHATTNMHALVLLALVDMNETGLANHVKLILVQLAVLISLGPTTIMSQQAMDMSPEQQVLYKNAASPDMALRLCYKGLLWQSLTHLRVFQRTPSNVAEFNSQPWQAFLALVRAEVAGKAIERTSDWAARLNVSMEEDATDELSADDEFAIERCLIRAYPFNYLYKDDEDGFFALDCTGRFYFDVAEPNNMVDWVRVKAEEPATEENPDKALFAVYSYTTSVSTGGLATVRAMEVTHISGEAVRLGLYGIHNEDCMM